MSEKIVNLYIYNKIQILKTFEKKFKEFKDLKKIEWIEKAKNIPDISSKVSNWEDENIMYEFKHILEIPDMNIDHLILDLEAKNLENRENMNKEIDKLFVDYYFGQL